MHIELYNKLNTTAGSLKWRFSDRAYTYSPCSGEYSAQLDGVPQQVDQLTWSISRTSARLTVRCSGVVVLDYAHEGSEACVASGGEDVQWVKFGETDTSSTFYRQSTIVGR